MAQLILGPLLRHIGATDATVWVETDTPCEVDILGRRERTFHVEGHDYAIVSQQRAEDQLRHGADPMRLSRAGRAGPCAPRARASAPGPRDASAGLGCGTSPRRPAARPPVCTTLPRSITKI